MSAALRQNDRATPCRPMYLMTMAEESPGVAADRQHMRSHRATCEHGASRPHHLVATPASVAAAGRQRRRGTAHARRSAAASLSNPRNTVVFPVWGRLLVHVLTLVVGPRSLAASQIRCVGWWTWRIPRETQQNISRSVSVSAGIDVLLYVNEYLHV